MESTVAVTEEMDDMRQAADDIISQVKNSLSLQKNSCGILFYDYEMSGDELARILEEELGFGIVGCSAIATLEGNGGYHDMSAMLTVLTADDCSFTSAITPPLTQETAKQGIVDASTEAENRAGAKPGLIYVLLPGEMGIQFDRYIDELTELAGYVPVIGGFPTSDGQDGSSMTFGGQFYMDRVILLHISGNVRPVFSIANVVSPLSERKGRITKAKDTTLYEIDGSMTFVEFIESYGLDVKTLAADPDNTFFQKYPLLIEEAEANSDEVPYVRVINKIDLDTGCGISYAGIPEGAAVSLANLTREGIGESLSNALSALLKKMEKQDGYRYSTIFCVTCSGRHLIMNPNYADEGRRIREMIPEHLHLSGFYSAGEMCPVSMAGGKAKNQLHNGSIVFCAV